MAIQNGVREVIARSKFWTLRELHHQSTVTHTSANDMLAGEPHPTFQGFRAHGDSATAGFKSKQTTV